MTAYGPDKQEILILVRLVDMMSSPKEAISIADHSYAWQNNVRPILTNFFPDLKNCSDLVV
jgi:hypothetical protein